MRTAGIDFDLRRVVICSLPLDGEGIAAAVFTEEVIASSPALDIAARYKLLYTAARDAWARHLQHAVHTDVVSVCVEQPGSFRGGNMVKLFGGFAAVCAATPAGAALCSMTATEWKAELVLPYDKAAAHRAFYARHGGEWNVNEHLSDALCVAVAWRQQQQGAQAA